MNTQDRLFGMAMRAAATLAPFARAAAVMAAPARVAAAWRPAVHPQRETAVPAGETPTQRAVRVALPQDPHPNPLPQAGEGEGNDRIRRTQTAPSFPLPLARVGWEADRRGAHRRVEDAAAPSAPLAKMPSSSGEIAASLRPAAAVPAMAAVPHRAPAKVETQTPSLPRVPATAPPVGAAAPTPWTPPPDTPPEPPPSPLDESRLARWLSGHLAAETRRPARGGTGFDPRLSPPWPGTLQGPWGWGG